MRLDSIAVLGGGPGGLYAARLAKLADPACAVTVYEQGEPDTTFGFGVGLAAGTQRKLEAADPDSLHDLVAAGRRHDMTLDVRGVGGGVVRVRNDRLIGVARTELLAILQRHAEKAGVALEFGARRSAADLDADVVVAADGVSSATREAGPFGEHVELGRGLYLWCGTDFALDDAVFAPVTTEHGVFVTHAYPYGSGRSTFLIETDEATWRRAGFAATTDATPYDASDETSLRYLETAFAAQLRGHPLIGNRTRWLRFRTVTATAGRRGAPCSSATPRTRRTSPSAPARSSRWRTRSGWSRRSATRRIGRARSRRTSAVAVPPWSGCRSSPVAAGCGGSRSRRGCRCPPPG